MRPATTLRRELAVRESNGIQVVLLCHPRAFDAFSHPFVYAA